MILKGNSLCLSGESTLLAYWWLHHCSYTAHSQPGKTQFTFSYFLLLLNKDHATVVHACVTFRMNYCNIFYPKGCQKVKKKAVADSSCSSSSPIQKQTHSISHWSSVVCVSFSPGYRTEAGYWSLTCSVQVITQTTWKYRKKKPNTLNFDRNIVFRTWIWPCIAQELSAAS